MTSREFKPPAHQHRALKVVVGCAIVFVVLAIVSIACATYLFTAPFSVHINHDGGHEIAGDDGMQASGTDRFFVEVQADGEVRVEADIELALGHVVISTAERGALFQAEGVVESSQLRPRFNNSSDGNKARVSLSLDGENVSFQGLRGTRGSRWQLYFSDSTPLDLNLTLGAADADLNFTGIPVENLNLECGMASATLRFDEPNPAILHRLAIEAGLSEFNATGLGNARFESLTFDGGAGEFTLDFSGESFMPGAEAELSVGIASLTILLSSGQPSIVEAPSSFMTKVTMPASFERIGSDTWASPNAADNDQALRITIDAGPGNIEVKLVD